MLNGAIWFHVVTVVSLVVFKLGVLWVGYLIAKLGYELLVKGVTGEFKLHAQYSGTTADLVSASPGIFFIFMATVLIGIAVIKDKPFDTKVEQTSSSLTSSGERSQPTPPLLPDKPPGEESK